MAIHNLGLEHIALSFATRHIFTDVTQGVFEGDRIGIVGKNGDGKSTLLRCLLGLQEVDSGRVVRRRDLRVSLLEQHDHLDDSATVREAVFGDKEEHEWAADSRSRSIVETLLHNIPLETVVGGLSGGQRRRADLARLLLGEWDVLALDEPTNHLDMVTIHWLAEHLKHRWPQGTGSLLIVTHDRWFLDEVCESMWEVHDGVIEPFEGGYSAYMLQRVERDRQADIRETKRRNLARKELAWLTRGARARSTKQKFHVKSAQALIADVPPMRNAIELRQMATSRLGKQVVDLIDVTHLVPPVEGCRTIEVEVTTTPQVQDSPRFSDAAGSEQSARTQEVQSARTEMVVGRPLLDNQTWLIGPGDRFGIVGANGAGKSTLLGIVQGIINPTLGHVKIGKTVKFAVLSQRLDELEKLGKYRVKEVLSRYKTSYIVDGKEVTPGQLMERLGFESAQLMTPIADLSGGQKRRMQLLLILLNEPNVLILDEPTNDLDTDMLSVLEDLLDGWPGTLLVVSHDRYFLERVTDRQFALLDGVIRDLPRGVEEYFSLVDEQGNPLQTHAELASPNGAGSVVVAGSANVTQGTQIAAAHSLQPHATSDQPHEPQQSSESVLSGKALHDAMRRVSAIDRKLVKMKDDITALETTMAQCNPSDFEQLQTYNEQLQTLQTEQETLEMEWMELSEEIENSHS